MHKVSINMILINYYEGELKRESFVFFTCVLSKGISSYRKLLEKLMVYTFPHGMPVLVKFTNKESTCLLNITQLKIFLS